MIQDMSTHSTGGTDHILQCSFVFMTSSYIVPKERLHVTLDKESIVMTVIPLWYFTVFYIKIPVSEVSGECIVVC